MPRALARAIRDALRGVRFRLWVARLQGAMRRSGGRLIIEAPHGLRFDAPPDLKVIARGDGKGTFTLRIGRNVSLGRHVLIEVWATGTNVLELHDDCYALDGVRLLLRSGTIRVGPKSNIRDYAILKSQGVLTLGEEVSVSHHDVLHCTERIELSDLVGMAERVTIVDSEKAADGSDTHFLRQPLRVEPVVIGRNTFIAAGSVVTLGTRVGPNAVVGAGSVLTGGEYPGGWIIAGTPARPIKALPRAADASG